MLRARKEINVPLISLRTLTDKHALKKRLLTVFIHPRRCVLLSYSEGETVLASKGVMGAEIEMALIERLLQMEEVSMDANGNVTVSPGLKG